MTQSKNHSKRNANSCTARTKSSASMAQDKDIMLTCRISPLLMKTLNKISKNYSLSRSKIIREALATYVNLFQNP